MKYVIKYHTIKGDSIFSMPEFTHEEHIETKSEEDLDEYIKSKSDGYGHKFKPNPSYNGDSVSNKFNYISSAGGVTVEKYQHVTHEFKKI